MNGLDCAKCQKSRQRLNSLLFHFESKNRAVRQWVDICDSRERNSAFSLDFSPFGPSVLDRARSKVDLQGEGNAWTLIWWSSDNSKR